MLLAFWGLTNMEHLLVSNSSAPTYWQDWAPAFQRVILDQFLDWIGVVLIGGAIGGGLVAYFDVRFRRRRRAPFPAAHIIVTILTLSIPLIALLTPRPAYACSCAPPGTPQETLADASAVFAGEVVRLKEPSPLAGIISSADPVRVTFAVAAVWKGPLQAELAVTTPLDGATCGYTFLVGQAYLVYAYGAEDSLQTHLCTRNQPLASAAEDLAALGPGSAPPPLPAAPAPPLPLLAVLAAVLLAGALLLRRN